MRKHLRLLPVVLFAGGLILTVKVGGLWSDLSVSAGAASSAEETPPAAAEAAAGSTAAEPAVVEETPPPELAAADADPETAAAPTMPVETAAEEAAGADAQAAAPEAAPGTAPETAGTTETAAPSDPFGFTDEEIDVLQSLAKRREQLDAQERALQQREALLTAAEQRMDQKLAELKTLQETISGLMKQHDEQAQAQLKSLVKIYENMKPKDAGRIFEQLEMDVLLDVVAGMKEQKVAAILAEVDPARAKDITLELSERRSLPIATE